MMFVTLKRLGKAVPWSVGCDNGERLSEPEDRIHLIRGGRWALVEYQQRRAGSGNTEMNAPSVDANNVASYAARLRI